VSTFGAYTHELPLINNGVIAMEDELNEFTINYV